VRKSLTVALLITAPFLCILAGVIVWNPAGNYWLMVEPPKAQCEAYDSERVHSLPTLTPEVYDQHKLDRLVREPQNTISNLAYIAAGLAILLAGRGSVSRSLGWAGIFLGFGSGIYHASLLPEWRMLDILGVYAVLYGLLLVGAATNYPRLRNGARGWGLVILAWTAAIYTGVHRNDVRVFGFKVFDSTYVFVAAVVVGCGLALLAYRRAQHRTAYMRAIAVFALAAPLSFAGGLGDRFGGFWAAPDSALQGHAVWHTFGAVAMLAIYEAFAAAGVDRSTLS